MSHKQYFTFLLTIILFALTACGGTVETGPAQPNQSTNSPVATLASSRVNGNIPAITLDNGQIDANTSGDTLGSGQINTNASQMSELQQNLASVSPDGNGAVTITISDDELTRAIATAQAALIQQGHEPIFQGPTFIFTNGQIIFRSTVNGENFSGDLEGIFAPYLSNNVLQLDLVSATVNGRPVPPVSLKSIETTMNTALRQAFSQLPPAVSLDQVSVQEGTLIITGSVNR